MPIDEVRRINPSSDPVLARIVRTIIDAINPKLIYLFGSRAEGIQNEESDYDFLLIYDGPLPKREVELKVVQSFKKHDFSMDLFILSSREFDHQKYVPTTLAREVFETGCIIDV